MKQTTLSGQISTSAQLARCGEWFTVKMLVDHCKKHRLTVIEALKRHGVTLHNIPGKAGYRIAGIDARRFVSLQCEVGPLPTNSPWLH